MSTPSNEIPFVPEGTLDPAAGLNLALDRIDSRLQAAVLSMSLTAPPGSPANGDMYIPAATATGDWTGEENNLARYVSDGAFWQFFSAGDQIKYVLNFDDGGFYKFIADSGGGSWVLAAGLGDAPIDGVGYVRRDATWQPEWSLTIQSEDNPSSEIQDVETIVLDSEFVLTEDTAGVARISLATGSQFAQVITESGTARDALPADAGSYVRFTNGALKTYTFDDAEAYEIGQEFHGRNAGSGDLEIVGTTGMTINLPFGGSLVIPADGTFTVKIVAADEADLFGVTVPSS